MRYKAHYLRKNEITEIPHHLIFFDTEAYLKKTSEKETKHILRLGVAWYVHLDDKANVVEEEIISFKEHNRFYTFVNNKANKHAKVILFAHNLWYDLRLSYFLHIACKKGWTITKFLNKQRVLYIRLSKNKKTIHCIDSMNYFPFSVEYLGKHLGKPKLKVDFFNVSDDELLTYCKRDVEIIKDMIIHYLKFIINNDLGMFTISLAGQALNAFTHRFMKHKIHIHHNKEIAALERKAYYGGRTEAFYIGKIPEDKIYYLDVNSMYPYVMKHKELPTQLELYTDKPVKKHMHEWINNTLCIAEVTIKTDKPYYPYRYGKKLIFPVGKFRTALCTESLRLALKNNHIVDIHKVAIYKSGILFDDYVDFFYNLKSTAKEKGDKVWYLLSKLFLNSLYGKFGQRIDDIVEVQNVDVHTFGREKVYDADSDEHLVINYLWNRIEIVRLNASDSYNTFVAISAHITDYARNLLLKYIEKAGWSNVYYCDTDSLFTNEKGYNNLKDDIDPSELGKLDIEGIYKDVTLYGAKDYKLDNEIKMKGIPKSAIKIDELTYEFEQFPRPLSDLRNGAKRLYTTKRVIKRLNRKYDKGIVTESGRVIPHTINESD